MLTYILCGYLIVLNLLLFVLMGRDKAAAQRGTRRTPETTLLALAVIALFIKLNWARFKAETSFAFTIIGIALVIIILLVLVIKIKLWKSRREKQKLQEQREKAEQEKDQA